MSNYSKMEFLMYKKLALVLGILTGLPAVAAPQKTTKKNQPLLNRPSKKTVFGGALGIAALIVAGTVLVVKKRATILREPENPQPPLPANQIQGRIPDDGVNPHTLNGGLDDEGALQAALNNSQRDSRETIQKTTAEEYAESLALDQEKDRLVDEHITNAGLENLFKKGTKNYEDLHQIIYDHLILHQRLALPKSNADLQRAVFLYAARTPKEFLFFPKEFTFTVKQAD